MTTTMIDAIHASVPNVPATTAKVAGYVSGTPDIQWTATDWARFPHSGKVRIEQGYGPWPPPDPHGYDVLDVEDRAVAASQVPAEVHSRISHGITWTTVYGSDDALKDVQSALIASEAQWGRSWYWGHVDCWLADWNLSAAQAAAMIGAKVHGMTCRAVQWASPTSNPGKLVPGSALTLKQANVDLSVTADTWFPPPVPTPPKTVSVVVTATYDDGSHKAWTIL